MPTPSVSVVHFAGDIEVFTNADAVPYAYQEIALISVDDYGYGSEQERMNRLLAQAEYLGADAVILLNQGLALRDPYVYRNVLTETLVVNDSRRILRASAIQYKPTKQPNVVVPQGPVLQSPPQVYEAK